MLRRLAHRIKLWIVKCRLGASSECDSDWYLAAYPDVAALGMNPQVHYELYGKREGRLPYLGASVYLAEAPKVDERTYWYFRLWGGFEHLVLPELTQRASEGRSVAQWLLAEWEYAHGNIDAAGRWLTCILGPDGPKSGRERIAASKVWPDRADEWLREYARQFCLTEQTNSREQWPCSDDLGQTPLVTVVVPAYNSAQHLPRALEGLLNQTWSNLEIIVVDDASTDNTAEVVAEIAQSDNRIRYLPNDSNMGAYPSRNRGMKAAHGEFVTVHDADDWSFPDKLETQLLPLLDDHELVATGSVWMRVTSAGQPVGSWMLGEPFLEPNHSAWLIRRTALDTVGLWDNVNVAADTEFLWRLEHHYGHQALHRVCPARPLSLALSDANTLTRAKATHVRTVFYGLRRLYREASNWWHRSSGLRPVMEHERPFPVPVGNLKRPPREFDVVVAANFATGGVALGVTLNVIKQRLAAGESICLLHWPDFDAWHGNPVADAVFQLAHDHSLGFVHPGFQVTAPTVVFVATELWQKPPTQSVLVEGLKQVVGADSALCEPQEELLRYFARGGVADALD